MNTTLFWVCFSIICFSAGVFFGVYADPHFRRLDGRTASGGDDRQTARTLNSPA